MSDRLDSTTVHICALLRECRQSIVSHWSHGDKFTPKDLAIMKANILLLSELCNVDQGFPVFVFTRLGSDNVLSLDHTCIDPYRPIIDTRRTMVVTVY